MVISTSKTSCKVSPSKFQKNFAIDLDGNLGRIIGKIILQLMVNNAAKNLTDVSWHNDFLQMIRVKSFKKLVSVTTLKCCNVKSGLSHPDENKIPCIFSVTWFFPCVIFDKEEFIFHHQKVQRRLLPFKL